MTTATEALVVRQVNAPLELLPVTLDKLRPDEALVEIHATGICHTDLSMINGTLPAAYPYVLGHEGAGVVVAVGDNIKHVSKGDKVLLSYNSCGHCHQCTHDHPAHCDTVAERNFSGRRADGSNTITLEGGEECQGNFFGQSSFARHAIATSSSLVKVPDTTDLALMAPLGCGIQTGSGTVMNILKVTPGTSIAVFGMGAVGLAAVMSAKFLGAKTIVAIDVMPGRLELAKELGATHGINGKDSDVLEQIKKIAPPLGVDFAVDCTGVPKVIETMIESLGMLGVAATVGAPSPDKSIAINVWNHLIHGRKYVGTHQGDSVSQIHLPILIEKHRQGLFPIEKLVKYYEPKDVASAFADMKSGAVIKPVLKWR